MVLPAAHPHGVLLQGAVARVGLARIQDGGRSAGDGVHEGAGERGDAGEVLQEVERRTFCGQHPPAGAAHLGYQVTRHDLGPVADAGGEADARLDAREDCLSDWQPGDDASGLSDDVRMESPAGRQRGLGGGVARADVLGDGQFDERSGGFAG